MSKPKCERSEKRGIPVLWERGGGFTKTGEAQIVCKPNGGKKIPLYVRTSGQLACENHALFAIHVGDLVIIRRYGHGEDICEVWKCTDPDASDFTLIHSYSDGEWDEEPAEELAQAVNACFEKSNDYHCRTAYWAAKKEDL